MAPSQLSQTPSYRRGRSGGDCGEHGLYLEASTVSVAVCQINIRPGTIGQADQQSRRSDVAVRSSPTGCWRYPARCRGGQPSRHMIGVARADFHRTASEKSPRARCRPGCPNRTLFRRSGGEPLEAHCAPSGASVSVSRSDHLIIIAIGRFVWLLPSG